MNNKLHPLILIIRRHDLINKYIVEQWGEMDFLCENNLYLLNGYIYKAQ